jgi:hypothetical protein
MLDYNLHHSSQKSIEECSLVGIRWDASPWPRPTATPDVYPCPTLQNVGNSDECQNLSSKPVPCATECRAPYCTLASHPNVPNEQNTLNVAHIATMSERSWVRNVKRCHYCYRRRQIRLLFLTSRNSQPRDIPGWAACAVSSSCCNKIRCPSRQHARYISRCIKQRHSEKARTMQ